MSGSTCKAAPGVETSGDDEWYRSSLAVNQAAAGLRKSLRECSLYCWPSLYMLGPKLLVQPLGNQPAELINDGCEFQSGFRPSFFELPILPSTMGKGQQVPASRFL